LTSNGRSYVHRTEEPTMMRSLLDLLRLCGTAAVGGAWGGVIAGLIEAVVVTGTSAPGGEYFLFPFGVVSYGLLGLGIGLAYGLLAALLAPWWATPRQHSLGGGAALALLIIGSFVTRYHVVQRVFHEELTMFSATGIGVTAAVVISVGLCALLLLVIATAVQRHGRGVAVAAGLLVLCIASSFAGAVLASPRRSDAMPNRTAGSTAEGRPNIILVIADTLRADAAANDMPAVQALARDGVDFETAYVQSSWTRPSIATILTSLYPSQHRTMHKMEPLPDSVTTLAEALRAKGYWTTGFVTNINVAPIFNFQQGFEEYVYLPPDFYFGATDSATRLAIYKGLRLVRERFFGDRIYFNNYYQDAEVVNGAVWRWLDQRPPTPFFLLVHYMDPHDPYFEIPYDGNGVARVVNPDPPAQRREELHQLYMENIGYLDRFLDELFSRLKKVGLYESSIIALTADHGEEFQEHGGWWHGTTLYEEQVRVPLLIKRASEPRAGEREARPARSVDIAPTLMAAAGLPVPPAFVGNDLFNPPAEAPLLLAEEALEGNVLSSLHLGPWKIITANPGNPRGLQPIELYNLDQDPGEQRNLATTEPARVAEMLRLLERERSALGSRVYPSAGL
jgi:arylsulfatase A-like enzyme